MTATGSKATTPANRFAWRKLHVEDDKLTLESRLGSEVLVIPRVAGEGGDEPKVRHRVYRHNVFL